MKQTTAAVFMLAICAAVTAFTIYITQSGWWIIAFVIAVMACQPSNDTKHESNSNSEVYPTSKYPQSKKQDIHLK
jgi:hypothetical protein